MISEKVPDDVLQAFSEEIPAQVQDSASGFAEGDSSAPDFTGRLEAIMPRAVDVFDPTAEDAELVASGEWIAALVRDGDVVGTVTVWRQNSQVVLNGYNDDAVLGEALVKNSAAAVINDAPIAAYYLYDGAAVTPANEPALAQVAGPAPLSDVQHVVAERNEAAGAASGADSVGGMAPNRVIGESRSGLVPGILGGIACSIAGLGLLTFWSLRWRRRIL
ncbi:hypothetical protein [Promicromonospora sp. AC04]|uniref:hypothetical protein n=1 Tax=Promicromonospora sp. AC04 TaxID=2135723 RepID=UPI0011B20BEF|nr:hypothetical protein [Promicromonospora sp. AC04]